MSVTEQGRVASASPTPKLINIKSLSRLWWPMPVTLHWGSGGRRAQQHKVSPGYALIQDLPELCGILSQESGCKTKPHFGVTQGQRLPEGHRRESFAHRTVYWIKASD